MELNLLIDFPFNNFCLLVLEADAAFELLSFWRRGSTYKTSPFRYRLSRQPLSSRGPRSPPHSRHPSWNVQPANVFLLFIPSRPPSPLRHPTLPHFLFPFFKETPSRRMSHLPFHIVYSWGIQLVVVEMYPCENTPCFSTDARTLFG